MSRITLFLIVASVFVSYCLSSPSPCHELASLLPGKVFFPGSNSYTLSVTFYYFRQQRELDPICIVAPSSVEDVSIAVKRLAELPDLTFAIRSGGHSPSLGAANAPNGITIDLRSLDTIQVDGSIVSVGGGVLWQDVYDALVPHGLVAVGAREGTVGTGGFLTGGGISAFSPNRGFACDNIKNVEVVLASGEIVNTNSTHNADLFAKLKGGQNNFGIVTRFDLSTFPQSDYWGGMIQYPSSIDEAQLKAFSAFKNSPFDPQAVVIQSFIFNSSPDPASRYASVNNLFYTEPIANPSALGMFTEVQPQLYSSLRISNLSDFTHELSASQSTDQYSVYATTTFRSSEAFLHQVHALWRSFTNKEDLSKIPDLRSVLTIQSIPPVIPSSPNTLGFPADSHPETDLILLLASSYWSDSAYSKVVESHTRTLIEEIEALAKHEDVDHPFRYMNYAAAWQDVIAGYGEQSVKELWEVSKEYDPLGVFQEKVPGGFKLPKQR
ncbi:FAD-binding domain-containing protein [Aspergillus karnatakaensis]|uniref:FAD-binding oxidoreductase n=1 Tax=Aspergillus karnatakaensis TaxID=1810916 RepID=UPI003CCD2D0F